MAIIWTLITSRLGGWIVGAALLTAVSTVGYLWIGSLRADVKQLEAKNQVQADTIEFFKKAAKIDVDTAKVQEEINEVVKSGDPQRRLDLLRKLRKMSAPASD
jgi:hypothetical protein